MDKKSLLFFSALGLSLFTFSQNVAETFNSSRIINGHSVETLGKKELEYRIEHRFGDIESSGLGFDQAADVRFAFEYGISDRLMIGVGRCKGATTNGYRGLVDGFVKYKLLEQKEKGTPVTITLIGASLLSYVKASSDVTSVSHYPKFAHRMAYSTQLNVARKMGEHFSLSLMPTWVHRNYVANTDVNDLVAIGAGASVKLSSHWGILTEYYYTIKGKNVLPDLANSFAIGAEWTTYGHSFHFNLSNSSLFNEAQFIPFTTEKWSKGQFRLGFSISRSF